MKKIIALAIMCSFFQLNGMDAGAADSGNDKNNKQNPPPIIKNQNKKTVIGRPSRNPKNNLRSMGSRKDKS